MNGLTSTMKPAALLAFITDIHAPGLGTAQGLYLTAAWRWDLNDKSLAWGKRFFDKTARWRLTIKPAALRRR